MAKQSQRRILRNYRNMTPSRFHAFNQRVRNELTDNAKIPESMWAANPTVISSYFSASDKHDTMFHAATYGSKLDIAEREALQSEIVDYLDEIASILEAAAIRNPDLVLSSGFDLAKERRSRPRAKAATPVSDEFKNSTSEQPSAG